MWNLEQNDNYILSVDGSGFESGEVINCISYNKAKGKTAKEQARRKKSALGQKFICHKLYITFA